MDGEYNFENLRRVLTETIAWCSPCVNVNDPANSLRTPSLSPQNFQLEPVKPQELLGRQYMESYVLSWVPPAMIDFVDSAIEANPVDCIHWATEYDTVFTRQLDSAGLLF